MKLVFDPLALEELRYWVRTDKRKATKILDLIDNTLETPFKDIGKPEAQLFGLLVPSNRSGTTFSLQGL